MTSPILYWRDGPANVTVEEVNDLGVGYAFPIPPTSCGNSCGPTEQAGKVFGLTSDHLGYHRDRQVWKQSPFNKALWIGRYTDRPAPGPDDLRREEVIDGHPLKAADGNVWNLPCAQRWTSDERYLCGFPMRMGLNPNGDWVLGEIKDKYAALWALAMEYEEAYISATVEMISESAEETVVRFDFPKLTELAIDVFACNYLVGSLEVDLLGLLDQDTRQAAIDVLLDRPSWNAWVKKKLPSAWVENDGSRSSIGQEQSTQETAMPHDTGQPLPRSEPTANAST